MKNVFMILFFLSGFAIASSYAQAKCTPCPPGCCILSCCVDGKSAAAAKSNPGTTSAALVSFSPEMMSGTCEGKKMSNKEVKACMAACQSHTASAPNDEMHVAPATNVSGSAAAPSCHTPCASGKSAQTASASATPSCTPAPVKQKS